MHNYSCSKSSPVSHVSLTNLQLKTLSVALKHGSQGFSVTCFCHCISTTFTSIVSIKHFFCFISVGQAWIPQTVLSACFLFCNFTSSDLQTENSYKTTQTDTFFSSLMEQNTLFFSFFLNSESFSLIEE